MKSLDRLIGSQIRRPTGLLGRLLGRSMGLEHRPLVAWTFTHFRSLKGGTVLDVGCGGGCGMVQALRAAGAGHVVGLDHSRAMVCQAHSRLNAEISKGQAAVVRGDVQCLPFADASFDAVYSIEALYFWPDPKVALRGLSRVLRSGGRLSLSMDISREARRPEVVEDSARRLGLTIYSALELAELLTAAGFEDVSTAAQPNRGQGWLLGSATRAD